MPPVFLDINANFVRDPRQPLAPKIEEYIVRNLNVKRSIFDEPTRKRGPPEPTDGLDAAKRQKIGAQLPAPPQPKPKFQVPPLKPGRHTIAELFTVTPEEGLKVFDVGQLPEDLVVKIGITILQRLDADTLNQAIEASFTHFSNHALHADNLTGCAPKISVIDYCRARND